METPADGPRSPDDAREALRQLAADEDAVRYPPLPGWFFPFMALVIIGVNVAQMSDQRSLPLAIVAVALVVSYRFWFNADGVAGVSPSVRDMLPFLLGIGASMVTAFVVTDTTDVSWAWVVSAAVCAVIVLVTGYRYQREHAA